MDGFAFLRRLRRLAAVDVGPLRRYRDFRMLFMGQVISIFGGAIRRVAMPYQIYSLTHSPLAVGVLGLFAIVPILLLALLGGALADARDRRRMVQVTEIGMIGLSALLLANALLPHPMLPVIYAVQAVGSGLSALQTPSLNAMLPRLVEREDLPRAGAVGELAYNIGSVTGPALAGGSIALLGLPGTYGIGIATFALSLAALNAMRSVPPPPVSWTWWPSSLACRWHCSQQLPLDMVVLESLVCCMRDRRWGSFWPCLPAAG